MNKNTQRLFELTALWSIAFFCLWIASHKDLSGSDLAALLLIVSTAINRISNLGQAQAMQSMADQLARSTPPTEPAP